MSFLINLKLKKKSKNAVLKFIFVIIYNPNQYKTQEICDKAILENGVTLKYGSLKATRIKICVTRLLIIMHMH